MPVSLICPFCGTAATFHRPPVTTCPNCQASFPAALRQPAEASLLRQNAPRPTLLAVGLYFAPGFGAMCLLGVLAAATNARFVKFTINGSRDRARVFGDRWGGHCRYGCAGSGDRLRDLAGALVDSVADPGVLGCSGGHERRPRLGQLWHQWRDVRDHQRVSVRAVGRLVPLWERECRGVLPSLGAGGVCTGQRRVQGWRLTCA